MFLLDEPTKDVATGGSNSAGDSESVQGWWGYMGKVIVSPAASFLPTQVGSSLFSELGTTGDQLHIKTYLLVIIPSSVSPGYKVFNPGALH